MGDAPGAAHVRFRVKSCGVCHSDVLGVEGRCADPPALATTGHSDCPEADTSAG